MTSSDLTLPAAAKAYVALVGAIASALLGVFAADSTEGKVLTIIVVVATAIATWAVPNATPNPPVIGTPGPVNPNGGL